MKHPSVVTLLNHCKKCNLEMYYFMSVCAWLPEFTCTMCAEVLRDQKTVGFPGVKELQVPVSCHVGAECWEANSGALQEQ